VQIRLNVLSNITLSLVETLSFTSLTKLFLKKIILPNVILPNVMHPPLGQKKRRNENAQQAKEEYDDSGVEDSPVGSFSKATASQMKGRKIIRRSGQFGKKSNGGSNTETPMMAPASAAAVPGGGGMFNSVNLGAAPAAAGGLFAFASAPAAAKPPLSNSNPTPSFNFGTAAANSGSSNNNSNSNSSDGAEGARLQRLNKAFLSWLSIQIVKNPMSSWEGAVKDYITQAKTCAQKDERDQLEKENEGVAPVPAPPQAPLSSAPAFSFGGNSSSAAPAPAAAAFSFGGAIAPATSVSNSTFSTATTTQPTTSASTTAKTSDEPSDEMSKAPPEIGKGASNPDEEITAEVRVKQMKYVDEELTDSEGKKTLTGKKVWKSYGVGVCKLWENEKIGKGGLRIYSGLRVSLNCLVTKGMKFDKIGGKNSAVKFMAVVEDGPGCFLLKTNPNTLDSFHAKLEALAA